MASWAERHLVNRAVRVGLRLGRDIDGVLVAVAVADTVRETP